MTISATQRNTRRIMLTRGGDHVGKGDVNWG